jgi:hypothetical protein
MVNKSVWGGGLKLSQSPRVVLALLPCLGLVLPACGSRGSYERKPAAQAEGTGAVPDGAACPEPTQVLAGVSYACGDGSVRQGTLTPPNVAACQSDGEVGCLATTTYRAADTTGLASKVVSTASVAGVAGTYTPDFPDAGNVRSSDTVNGANGTLADCTLLGRTDCYTGLSWTAVESADLAAANIRSGVTVGGVEGNAATRPANCASEGASDCVVDGGTAYRAADTTGLASKVVSTASVAGVAGTYTPDFPDAGNVRSSDTVNGAAGTLADCSTDGATNCTIPSSGSIKAADTANFTGWDIRKKRNQSTGSVLTFAGLQGQNKTCRNRANAGTFDNTTLPAVAGLDFFDTIDDYVGSMVGLPGQIPAWTMISGIDYGADFACGGIYATGSTATENTGADASLAHDANGNWQDLTPGIVPGGAPSSTNAANGCNATDKHCVFRELISGLMVTEISALGYNWTGAITYCNNLGEDGGAVTSPIPVIGGESYSDWRLPTQKELMQLAVASIKGLNQTAALRTNFGNFDNYYFWSSSSVSYYTTDAWFVYLSDGGTYPNAKSDTYRAVCVR